MKAYLLSSQAVLDLEEIWDYIADDSPDAADRWVEQLFEAFEAIACTPGIGHRRAELTSYPVLFWRASEYLVIYRARENQPVEIVAITQGSRDIPRFLRHRLR